jgi:hypothetical protein
VEQPLNNDAEPPALKRSIGGFAKRMKLYEFHQQARQ